MARITLPAGDLPESYRVFGLQPDMGKALVGLSQAIYEKSIIDKRVREGVRMRIAQINQCHICLGYRFPELQAIGVDEAFYDAVGSWRTSALFSEREKIAIDYAERFLTNHLGIDDAFFASLRTHFSDAEIFDLTGIIGGLLTNGRMMQVLQLEQSCALDSVSG
jgi:alkylhydroperoxidase family enzyme